eukprot:784903_1
MGTDYVLPVSSINKNLSISNGTIWNILLNDICEHFNLDSNTHFKEWFHTHDRTEDRKDLMKYLSARDIYALRKYNYYDIKLFNLAQWISKLTDH